MIRVLTVSLLLVLAGCAAPKASVKPVPTPNGVEGYHVSCDGSIDDWATCYAGAAQACGGKFSVVDRNESSTPTAYGPLVRRSMIVECKR